MFALLGSVRNFLQNPYDVLGTLLHYLEKFKNQFFCRYSAYMEENANKLHFECTDEYPSPVISYRRYCGSAACPFDSRLNDDCLNVFSVRALRGLLLHDHLSTVPMSGNFSTAY